MTPLPLNAGCQATTKIFRKPPIGYFKIFHRMLKNATTISLPIAELPFYTFRLICAL